MQSASAANEEMVSRLIVKPRALAGAKLAGSLQAFDASGLSRTANMPMTVFRPTSDGAHVIKLDQPVTLSEARVIAERLMRNDSSVEFAEPDRIMYPTAVTPADPDYATLQWHYFAPAGANLGGANLPDAWAVTQGSATINVAVIDTGYRPHADLGTAVLPGYDFIIDIPTANDGDGRDTDAQDPGDWVALNECGAGSPASDSSWHGTLVAGTIAAAMNNGISGTGVAPNVRILPVRALGKCGGFTSDIADGMRWAAGLAVAGVPANPNPAQVLNLSLGVAGACSATFQNAVNDVVNAGKVIVAAAGNDGSPSVISPANCIGVIAVTAHAIDGDNAWYANVGTVVAISAPGGGCGTLTHSAATCTDFSSANGLGVYSLMNTGTTIPGADSYSVERGTSMAAPHVAGVVALMLSVKPTLTPANIKSYLQSSARAHPAGTYCTTTTGVCGSGLLDAAGALNTIPAAPPTVVLTSPSQVVAPNAVISLAGSATAEPPRTINTYSWTQLTGAAVIINNANTANATFTAPATGTYSFRLTATDNTSRSGTADATVRVNSAPVPAAVAPQTVVVGSALNFTVGATDVDGDTPIFHSVSLPAGATLSAQGAFSWPSATPLGSYTMTYYASDNDTNSANVTVDITVVSPASSGGGGGCSLSLNPETPDPALPVMMVVAGLYLLRRRLVWKA
ncbi:MAG: S8 family serine peptidase [Gallionella sp.]|nr:S8 family serine peptidase [Gallionella sp.]